jgi:hypothetical protein
MTRHLPQQTNLVNADRSDALGADCWLELQWVQTYSSTRALCSIERSNALTDGHQYLEDVHFVRAHHYQNNSRR